MKKVILIEDDVYFSDDLKYLIEDKGITCVVCHNASDLLNTINGLEGDELVILDLMMRKPLGSNVDFSTYVETGETLFDLLREQYPEIRIAIVTAKNGDDISNPSIKNDQNTIIFIKPLDIDNFEKILDFGELL